MERITPNEPLTVVKSLTETDPFGDSFTAYQLLPPPDSTRSRHLKVTKYSETSSDTQIAPISNSQPFTSLVIIANGTTSTEGGVGEQWLEKTELSSIPLRLQNLEVAPTTHTLKTNTCEEVTSPQSNDEVNTSLINTTTPICTLSENSGKAQFIDAFSDLDPLGTGKSKPYIDKKYFFQDLKNPPKKVLKDLSQKDTFAATFKEREDRHSELFEVVEENYELNAHNKSSDLSANSIPGKTFILKNTGSNICCDNEKVLNKDLEKSQVEESIMIKRDTDPFSPTRKKSDPFQEGDIFTKLDPFEFELHENKQALFPETKIMLDESMPKKDLNSFNGPLQVSLPPEDWNSSKPQKKIDRQESESPTSNTRNRPNVFKQNTVDVISSISSKKMPHLFGQKFSKRDSNSINMRRLQESDSLSENEAAPEPPPRPDSVSRVEPPPLPPKKQFSDIVIRPKTTSPSITPPPARYDYATARTKSARQPSLEAVPPIPLPLRKMGRSDVSSLGPGRPGRKPGEEEDYLTPITNQPYVPPLLPPPQTKSRSRRYEYLDTKADNETATRNTDHSVVKPILPNITLSQLLTLGIDELAVKLNVPTSKLNHMTLVELTAYLSNFIESSKDDQQDTNNGESSVFKVNSENHDATFTTKFDNVESESNPFIANFADFDSKTLPLNTAASNDNNQVPSEDRYAVFREIMEQEKKTDGSESLNCSKQEAVLQPQLNLVIDSISTAQTGQNIEASINTVAKIDTKITEVISHAKDRYAALRDIILVEDLFEKPILPLKSSQSSNLADNSENEVDIFTNSGSPREPTSPENVSRNGNETKISERKSIETIKQEKNFLTTLTVSNVDDLEIDKYMNHALSNLSLDSRDCLTPGFDKSPIAADKSTSPKQSSQNQNKSPSDSLTQEIKSQFNDMSTSPIPQQKSPALKSPVNISSHSKPPPNKFTIPQSLGVVNVVQLKKRRDSDSMSDVVCESSPEVADLEGSALEQPRSMVLTTLSLSDPTESWLIFDKSGDKSLSLVSDQHIKCSKNPQSKGLPESPYSSDAKEDWKSEQQYIKKWPKGQTSSSSRDLSPWDDETSGYKKRPSDQTDRHGCYMRHTRRMNSCDDDYEYDNEVSKRREKRINGGQNNQNRGKDLQTKDWYRTSSHHHWSPAEDDGGSSRSFDRNSYDRGTYGPPLRDHKMTAHKPSSYDRRYEKRKYYREYCRPEYDFESYQELPDIKDHKIKYFSEKGRKDYETMYEESFGREGRGVNPRSFFYDREKNSFDRDSAESYDSTNRRQRTFASARIYGSLDSREQFRDHYVEGVEKARSLRKSIKMRSNEDYEQDSDNGDYVRRSPGDSRSLQRVNQNPRIRKSSGLSPWDGEDSFGPVPATSNQKGWKRPSSASESEKRLAENRRLLCRTLSGSDGEKDRRLRRRCRPRGKDGQHRLQQSFGPQHDPITSAAYDYMGYDECVLSVGEDNLEHINCCRQDIHQRIIEAHHSEVKKKSEKNSFDSDVDDTMITPKYGCGMKKDSSVYTKGGSKTKCDMFEEISSAPPRFGKNAGHFLDFDEFEDTPRSNTSSSKFNFEEQGFESDFNTPPSVSNAVSSAATKSSFRFSNDFSDNENKVNAGLGNFESELLHTAPVQKLRFDDNITVSNFDNDQPTTISQVFEDDFTKADFVRKNEDRWSEKLPKRNNNSRFLPKQRQDPIKKSESVNIFGRKSEDPFENDDFFKSLSPPLTVDKEQSIIDTNSSSNNKKNEQSIDNSFKWENNFAKFEENM